MIQKSMNQSSKILLNKPVRKDVAHYEVLAKCTNCGHEGILLVPKGNRPKRDLECPKCACNKVCALDFSHGVA